MIPTVYTVIQHPLNKFILQPQKQLYLGKLMEKVLLLFAETTHTKPCEDLQKHEKLSPRECTKAQLRDKSRHAQACRKRFCALADFCELGLSV